jgi:hypothetical protein
MFDYEYETIDKITTDEITDNKLATNDNMRLDALVHGQG